MSFNQPTQTAHESKVNLRAFMRQARIIMDNKVFYDRAAVKALNVMDTCFEIATLHLGKDMAFLVDVGSVSQYITDVFGAKNANMFMDGVCSFGTGQFNLDMEHGLLLYYKLLSENSPLAPQALGLLHFLAGHQLDDEFTQINKVAPRSMISPAFELDEKLFRWKRCNFVLRKYMLELSKPSGYDAYYFEKPRLGQIAYLSTKGQTFEDAETTAREANGGLFYSYLPMHLENLLIPNILNGTFFVNEMDGMMKQSYIRDAGKIELDITFDDVYNVYNSLVKPNMLELMGMVIGFVNEEIGKNTYLSQSDAGIYHVSPHRIGILVKQGLTLEEVLPTLSTSFKPVQPLDLAGLVDGEFL